MLNPECRQRSRFACVALGDEALVEKPLDHAPPQVLGHARQVAQGNETEAALRVEAALQDQGVEVGIPAQQIPEGLIGDHCGRGELGPGCPVVEVVDDAEQ